MNLPQSIVLSLDQGWGNGVVAAQDLNGVRRAVQSCRQLGDATRGRFMVSLGLCPSFAFGNPKGTEAILDTIKSEGGTFWLEVLSSDVLAMMAEDVYLERLALGAPYDLGHGLPFPVQQLDRWIDKYGDTFVGMRSHETFTTWRTIACWHNNQSLPWAKAFAHVIPGNAYYDLKLVEPFAARSKKKPLLWSEPMWSRSEKLWPGTPRADYSSANNEKQLRDLINVYSHPTREDKGRIYVGFANNYPASLSRQFDYWNDLDNAVFRWTNNCAGWFLGCQSWGMSEDGRGNTATDAMLTSWTTHALRYGARVVWIEPPWWLLNFPLYSFLPAASKGANTYPSDPQWRDRSGTPTDSLWTLAHALSA